MQHQQVIDNFINKGTAGRGTYVKGDEDVLYAKFPQEYRPWGSWGYDHLDGQTFPLAVRLEGGKLLVNGARLEHPASWYQENVLQFLENAESKFAVVPFHSIVAALTNGEVREWNRKPIPAKDLQREVAIVVPSGGERWRTVSQMDKHGVVRERRIHTLGDSVIKVHDHYFASAVDETGVGNGMYFLTELQTDRAPKSLKEAFEFLKPQVVREAEARGANVLRQGEWFAIPSKVRTKDLMRDVDRGIARFYAQHVLGRDGHHRLEEAVIYRQGPRKGEVYARGVLEHTKAEHVDLNLGTFRWHLVVHAVQGASYTLTGGGAMAQFD
ncbi:MAG: hypothetical protein LAP13_22060 [Acidobacteriia bacterium]|nr:hypothetical protein [Terriglobia bacterium]